MDTNDKNSKIYNKDNVKTLVDEFLMYCQEHEKYLHQAEVLSSLPVIIGSFDKLEGTYLVDYMGTILDIVRRMVETNQHWIQMLMSFKQSHYLDIGVFYHE